MKPVIVAFRNFATVRYNNISTTVQTFPWHTKLIISSQAPSKKQQIGEYFTDYLKIMGNQYGKFSISILWPKSLAVALKSFEKYVKTQPHCAGHTLLNVRRSFGKQRTFCHTKIFIDNRKETEYAGFITHLHLLLHIVILNNEALVVP